MALIYPGIKCSLCEQVIEDRSNVVATTHFIGDCNDPLWRYSDSAMHPECFANWELRSQFIERYNSAVSAVTWGNGTYHEMQQDGSVDVRRRCPEINLD